MENESTEKATGWWDKWWFRFVKAPEKVIQFLPLIVVGFMYNQNNKTHETTLKFVHDNYQSIIATKNMRIEYLESRNDKNEAIKNSLYKLAGRQEVINSLK